MSDHPETYLPDILFLGPLFLPLPTVPGLAPPPRGFPAGSSVLVSGRPGSGKRFFCLALIRALMRQPGMEATRLYYVSAESTGADLRRRYADYGWFDAGKDDVYSLGERVQILDIREGDLPQPTSGAEELINPLMMKVRKLAPLERGRRVFVLVDTLTALVKDSRDAGDRRRNINEILHRLRSSLSDALALTFLISEGGEPGPRGPSVEETIADFVFHLALKDIGFGRRGRTLEVRKHLEAMPMLLGEHSWEILSQANLSEAVALTDLRREIRRRSGAVAGPASRPPGPRPDRTTRPRWGTALISPYPRLPAIGELQKWTQVNATLSERRLTTGVPGLDEMLGGETDYWSRPLESILARETGPAHHLREGSTTLILGRSGTGKTTCCLQFLLEDHPPEQCLYVNFENRPHRVLDFFPGDEASRQQLSKCKVLYRRRSHLDLNLLVGELHFLVRECGVRRIALDGLSDLLSVLGERAFARLVEDMTVAIRNAVWEATDAGAAGGLPPYLTLLLALDSDAAPAAMSRIDSDSFADNVIVLRQLTLNDERRKTIQVIKSRGNAPDRLVRELVVLKGVRRPLRVVPGLENYRNLLDGSPEPVRVTLQLIEENCAQRAFNAALYGHLRQLFGYSVDHFGFARSAIARTLADIASGVGRIPYADVKLLNVDEWWIRELRLPGRRDAGRSLVEHRHPLLSLLSLLAQPADAARGGGPESYASDFWICELEKASVPLLLRPSGAAATAPPGPRDWDLRLDLVAMPSYLDFGLFCLNREVAEVLCRDLPLHEAPWPSWLDRLPRAWARREGDWFGAPDPSARGTLVDLLARARDDGRFLGFCLDMETSATTVCAFLGLCWAFGASEIAFIEDIGRYAALDDAGRARFAAEHPATVALEFLEYLVAEGLMPPRTSLADARRSLFARTWYSSLDVDPATVPPAPPPEEVAPRHLGDGAGPGDHRERSGRMFLHPLPFFPVGTAGDGTGRLGREVILALADALTRFGRLLDRIRAAVSYREDLWPDPDPAWAELPGWVARVARERATVAGWRESPPEAAAVAGQLDGLLSFLRETGATLRAAARRSSLFQVGRGVRRPAPPDATSPEAEAWRARWQPTYPAAEPIGDRQWRRLPAAMFLDLRDVLLLLDWHDLRVALLEAERVGRGLGQVLAGPGRAPAGAPAPRAEPGTISALTGYACEGSWMVAVDRTTRSPNLAAKFLLEMTSPERAEQRAARGAGIPARKDFYDYHGREPVPCFPAGPMTWDGFLRLVGARARRRERSFCSRLRISDLFGILERLVLHGLTIAAELKGDYAAPARREAAIADLRAVAARSMREFFDAVLAAMAAAETAPDGARHPCLTCPAPATCRQVFAPAPSTPARP